MQRFLFASVACACLLLLCRTAPAQTLDFGNVQMGQHKDSSAVLTNPTPVPYTVSTAKFKKTPSEFSILSGGPPFTIPGNGSHAVSMRFTPSGEGLRSDSLYLAGSFPGSPLVVALTGTGDPLPVELALFTAERAGERIHLRWTTASESGNHGFDIQRRGGQGDPSFQVIGFLPGAGDSWSAKHYDFWDAPGADLLRAPLLEYRLKQIDFDGGSSLSPVVRIAQSGDDPETLELDLFPNPCAGTLTVGARIPAGEEVTGILVVDPAGRMRRMPVAPEGASAYPRTALFAIDTRALPAAGAHLLRIETRHGVVTRTFLHLR